MSKEEYCTCGHGRIADLEEKDGKVYHKVCEKLMKSKPAKYYRIRVHVLTGEREE